jgi:hypothetical protein
MRRNEKGEGAHLVVARLPMFDLIIMCRFHERDHIPIVTT